MNPKNRIGYFVDKVTEDSFYENLLLGLPKVLDRIPNIHDRKLRRNPPVTKSQVKNWESKNGIKLPQDLHNFYISCDGILYTYTFTYDSMYREDNLVNKYFGKIQINSINSLGLIDDYQIKHIAKIYYDGGMHKLQLSSESKVFELYDNTTYKLTLVYTNCNSEPTIWLYFNGTFHFIANDVTSYLRMAVAHLGVPYWEFSFTPLGLPGRTKEILNIIAPGILQSDSGATHQDCNIPVLNKIIPNIFYINLDDIESKKCNTQQHLIKKSSGSSVGQNSSSATITKKSSVALLGREHSSIGSTRPEKIRKSRLKHRSYSPNVDKRKSFIQSF